MPWIRNTRNSDDATIKNLEEILNKINQEIDLDMKQLQDLESIYQ